MKIRGNADKRRQIRKIADAEAPAAAELAGRIWNHAELGFREVRSAGAIAQHLAANGFNVEFPLRNVPTAFRASYGRGKPVLGLLAEYDALPDCGKEPGTPGHACGHNLIGAGAAIAAAILARLVEAGKLRGTIVVWGCPAEELLAGKAYMARDGAFRELDACIEWHPAAETRVDTGGGTALDSLLFGFFGKTAHGAYADHGRSAVDAAILADVAVNYLREHVPEDVRIHSVIRKGGNAPNVVPEYAESWYFVRARNRKLLNEITRRVTLCAKGAAAATETRMKRTYLTGIYERLPNDALAELILENLRLFGAPRATPKDMAILRKMGRKANFAEGMADRVSKTQTRASNDADTVSWLAPFGYFSVASVSRAAKAHHRDYTAESNLPFAHRGMMRAAETMAGTAWDLMAEPSKLKRIRAEFERRAAGFVFDPLVPARQKPEAACLDAGVRPRTSGA